MKPKLFSALNLIEF